MRLSTEETKTIYRDNNCVEHSSRTQAEMTSIMRITGLGMDYQNMADFLNQLFTHHDLRQWVLEQLGKAPVQALTVDQLSNVLTIAGRRSGVQISDNFSLAHEVAKLLYTQPAKTQLGDAIPNTGATLQDLPSKLREYYEKRNWCSISEHNMFREIGIMLEQDGYRLIKK